jgi:hypothetical protein
MEIWWERLNGPAKKILNHLQSWLVTRTKGQLNPFFPGVTIRHIQNTT